MVQEMGCGQQAETAGTHSAGTRVSQKGCLKTNFKKYNLNIHVDFPAYNFTTLLHFINQLVLHDPNLVDFRTSNHPSSISSFFLCYYDIVQVCEIC